MHEHIARAMYYFSVHLLYASIVGSAAIASRKVTSNTEAVTNSRKNMRCPFLLSTQY